MALQVCNKCSTTYAPADKCPNCGANEWHPDYETAPAAEPVQDEDEPVLVPVAEQKAAGVPPEATVTLADQKAGVPPPELPGEQAPPAEEAQDG